MSVIAVKSEHQYDIHICDDWLKTLTENITAYSRIAIFYPQSLKENIPQISIDSEVHYFPLPEGEAAKSIKTLATMWDWMGAAGFTRSDLVVAIGGGTITDVAGFLSATWLRGMDWIAVPTTLAGMVDASVGGKTGINSDYGKNLIGSFHSPQKVIIDSHWLESLSARDIAAGLAEVIKTGFIGDPQILEIMEKFDLVRDRSNYEIINELIQRSVAVKAHVVSADFKESFEREILNYGHTLGHAIEKHSQYSLRHGEAVSIGLVFAAHLSQIHCGLDATVVAQHIRLLTNLGLPISYEQSAFSELLALMSVDKKSRGKMIRFVGISQVGTTQRLEGLSTDELAHAYEKISI
ncbi:MAG: 3-dehydroquinate synthase [Actinobacteria bacterium]|uniref:3-dehydroquinate synthase n=1 Tax=freshwater metagenome TaxID=449393 RepID=A0A6J6TH94_9ZZZZ|nr:3-dehydroquinate synthase [Actinomycetota bacterium]